MGCTSSSSSYGDDMTIASSHRPASLPESDNVVLRTPSKDIRNSPQSPGSESRKTVKFNPVSKVIEYNARSRTSDADFVVYETKDISDEDGWSESDDSEQDCMDEVESVEGEHEGDHIHHYHSPSPLAEDDENQVRRSSTSSSSSASPCASLTKNNLSNNPYNHGSMLDGEFYHPREAFYPVNVGDAYAMKTHLSQQSVSRVSNLYNSSSVPLYNQFNPYAAHNFATMEQFGAEPQQVSAFAHLTLKYQQQVAAEELELQRRAQAQQDMEEEMQATGAAYHRSALSDVLAVQEQEEQQLISQSGPFSVVYPPASASTAEPFVYSPYPADAHHYMASELSSTAVSAMSSPRALLESEIQLALSESQWVAVQ